MSSGASRSRRTARGMARGGPRTRAPAVSRSVFALNAASSLVDDRDRLYFGRETGSEDHVGSIDASTHAVFGRSYAAEPDDLVSDSSPRRGGRRGRHAAAPVPNQLGLDCNAHVIESVLAHVAPELGRR